MEILTEIVDKFVKRSDKTKNPSKKRTNSESEKCIPDKKIDNANFSRRTFLPGDPRMKNISEDSGNRSRNKRG